MSRTQDFTETVIDWVDGRISQNMLLPLWLGGGIGPSGGTTYRRFNGQLTQKQITFDTTEGAIPWYPSGFGTSLVDNLNRMRHWFMPASRFKADTVSSGLQMHIGEGIWYPAIGTLTYFAGGRSPTLTFPNNNPRIDVLYINASGNLVVEEGTENVSPIITLSTDPERMPLFATYVTPSSTRILWSGGPSWAEGQAYIKQDLRPFLNWWAGGSGGGGGGEDNTASNQGVGGVGLYWRKNGIDLQFKNINAASNKITITNDPTNHEVDINIDESNIKLDNLDTPEDNTDLNVTTTHHGLTPKLDDADNHYLDGKGNWTIPSGVENYDEFTKLTDTPGAYTGYGSMHVTVAPGEDELEFTWVEEDDITDLYHDADAIRGSLVSSQAPTNGQVLLWDGSWWEPTDPVTTFVQLTDVPNSYTGYGNKFVTVTNGENALEFTGVQEADITDLDHDAQKIKGKVVNASGIGHNKVLAYDSNSDTIVYVAQSGGGGSGGTTSFFVPTTEVYTFECGYLLEDGLSEQEAHGSFSVPTNYVSDLKVKVIIRSPYGSGYCYGYNYAFYGQCGENYNTHTADDGVATTPIVTMHNNCVYELALSNATVGDIVGLMFVRRGDLAQDTINQDIWTPGWIVSFT